MWGLEGNESGNPLPFCQCPPAGKLGRGDQQGGQRPGALRTGRSRIPFQSCLHQCGEAGYFREVGPGLSPQKAASASTVFDVDAESPAGRRERIPEIPVPPVGPLLSRDTPWRRTKGVAVKTIPGTQEAASRRTHHGARRGINIVFYLNKWRLEPRVLRSPLDWSKNLTPRLPVTLRGAGGGR